MTYSNRTVNGDKSDNDESSKALGAEETIPSTNSPVEPDYTFHEKNAVIETSEGGEPTAEEKRTLTHVGEWLPARIWLVAIVELCERFTYYGMQGLFQNYVSHDKGYGKSSGLGNHFWPCEDMVGPY